MRPEPCCNGRRAPKQVALAQFVAHRQQGAVLRRRRRPVPRPWRGRHPQRRGPCAARRLRYRRGFVVAESRHVPSNRLVRSPQHRTGAAGRCRRPSHRQAVCHPQRGLCATCDGRDLAAAGDADRTGRHEAGRQRARCGHCCRCRARLDGADRQRRRRRLVRDRVGFEDTQALRLQRLRTLAEIADAGRIPEARADRDPGVRPAAGDGARHGRCVVCAARQVRQAANERCAGADHPLRARRFPGQRGHRLLLECLGAAAVEVSRFQRAVHARWSRPAHRRNVETSDAGRHPAEDFRRRSRRVLQGRHRAHHRRLLQGQRRLPQLRRSGVAPWRMGRAGEHQLSRLRPVGTAAQRPGHRRVADHEPARRL